MSSMERVYSNAVVYGNAIIKTNLVNKSMVTVLPLWQLVNSIAHFESWVVIVSPFVFTKYPDFPRALSC